MKYKKYKKWLVKIILNFLVEDHSSWMTVGKFILAWPKTRNWSKKTSIRFSREHETEFLE